MRKRFLVLSAVAALSLASIAGAASASVTVTSSISCWGAAGTYSRTSTLTLNRLPPTFKPFSYTYSFPVAGGTETCTISVK